VKEGERISIWTFEGKNEVDRKKRVFLGGKEYPAREKKTRNREKELIKV